VLLALAAARPVRPTDAPLARHTVFILDTSGSMAATDGRPDRLAEAKARAKARRGQLPAGGLASLVVASSEPRVALSASPDPRAFSEALAAVPPAAGAADFSGAFNLARALKARESRSASSSSPTVGSTRPPAGCCLPAPATSGSATGPPTAPSAA
jgi:Ca-activated chloride channel family protein